MKAGYVKRFSPVERLLHWVNAAGFFFLLATGLILYLPSLSQVVVAPAERSRASTSGEASGGSARSWPS